MSLRLALLECRFPKRLRLRMLDELLRVTAQGFDLEVPRWSGGRFEDRCAAYAEFTAREAERLIAAGDMGAIESAKDRLRRGAVMLGTRTRHRLRIRKPVEALGALKLLYHQIGIEADGGTAGGDKFVITHCFFSGYYSERACQVVSALDEGLASGLFDGASLEFSERITGGRPCCRAVLRPRGSKR